MYTDACALLVTHVVQSVEMFWDETREALVGVVEKAVQYDEDGIDIYFFNSTVVVENLRTAQDVRSLFRRVEPRRSTPTAKALKRVLEPYLKRLEDANAAKQAGRQSNDTVKPLNIVVLTDGAPDRNDEPEGVIVVSRQFPSSLLFSASSKDAKTLLSTEVLSS